MKGRRNQRAMDFCKTFINAKEEDGKEIMNDLNWHFCNKDQNSPSSGSKESATRSKRSESPEKHLDDEDDDFDPRATSKGNSNSANPQVDLFGDLMDAPTSMPSETGSANNNSSIVDLFADATFLSTAPAPKDSGTGGNAQFQPNIDLFASEPASSAMASSTVDFFAVSNQVVQPEAKAADVGATSVNSFNPFAAVPLNNFNDPDPFGAFTSVTDSSSSDPTLNTIQRGKVNDMNSIKSSPEAKTTPKNDSFQVKSGIWADSLSRGIIDLNITAPKKASLADVGIVGG